MVPGAKLVGWDLGGVEVAQGGGDWGGEDAGGRAVRPSASSCKPMVDLRRPPTASREVCSVCQSRKPESFHRERLDSEMGWPSKSLARRDWTSGSELSHETRVVLASPSLRR